MLVVCTHWALIISRKHDAIASCLMYTASGGMPMISSSAAVGAVLLSPVIYRQASLCRCSNYLLTVVSRLRVHQTTAA